MNGGGRMRADPFRSVGRADSSVPWMVLALLLPGLLALARPGQPAPVFSLPGSRGAVSLEAVRGRVVYLDFWASWCTPCKRSFPWMNELQQRYSGRGLMVIAINLDKTPSAAAEFVAEHPAEFAIGFDPGGQVADAYGVRAMPSSYLIGRDGQIRSVHWGAIEGPERERVTAELEALLVSPPAPPVAAVTPRAETVSEAAVPSETTKAAPKKPPPVRGRTAKGAR